MLWEILLANASPDLTYHLSFVEELPPDSMSILVV